MTTRKFHAEEALKDDDLLLTLQHTLPSVFAMMLRPPQPSAIEPLDSDYGCKHTGAASPHQEPPCHGSDDSGPLLTNRAPHLYTKLVATHDPLYGGGCFVLTRHIAADASTDLASTRHSLYLLSCLETPPGFFKLSTCNLSLGFLHARSRHPAANPWLQLGSTCFSSPDLLELIFPTYSPAIASIKSLDLSCRPLFFLELDSLIPKSKSGDKASAAPLNGYDLFQAMTILVLDLEVFSPGLGSKPHLPQESRCLRHLLQSLISQAIRSLHSLSPTVSSLDPHSSIPFCKILKICRSGCAGFFAAFPAPVEPLTS
mmetsp:Transcript_67897/g.162998  ORF Transcript_67897/g.162998 Transcript_67897/m.162998 type:complete len:314 (+) Transcript_67897:193-1134(+)